MTFIPPFRPTTGSYIALENGLYISQEKVLHGENHDQQQRILHGEGVRMPTIPEFQFLLRTLRAGTAVDEYGNRIDRKEQRVLYNETAQVRGPWRSEYLDAFFYKENGIWKIRSHRFDARGKIKEVAASLEACLMEDRLPGISLDGWLKNPTSQGLPKPQIKKGSLWYFSPRDGSVARFIADSVGAVLVCDWDPRVSYSGLGVRIVRREAPQKKQR